MAARRGLDSGGSARDRVSWFQADGKCSARSRPANCWSRRRWRQVGDRLGAAALGTLELLAAFLLFTPRFRRWGGVLGSALMIFFIGWIAYYYKVLVGHECNCFPIIKRTVGPGFFIGDGIMLLLGLAAWAWSPRVARLKVPALAFVSLAVLAAASFGVNATATQKCAGAKSGDCRWPTAESDTGQGFPVLLRPVLHALRCGLEVHVEIELGR